VLPARLGTLLPSRDAVTRLLEGGHASLADAPRTRVDTHTDATRRKRGMRRSTHAFGKLEQQPRLILDQRDRKLVRANARVVAANSAQAIDKLSCSFNA